MPRKVQGGRRSSKRGVNMRPGGSLYTNTEKSLNVKTLNASKDVNAEKLLTAENITTKKLDATENITTTSKDSDGSTKTIELNANLGKITTIDLNATGHITTTKTDSDGITRTTIDLDADLGKITTIDSNGDDTITLNAESGNIRTKGLNADGNVTIKGNLEVRGATTTVQSSNLDITDINILLAKGSTDGDGAGLTVDGPAGAEFKYLHNGDKWTMNKPLEVGGNITTTKDSDGTITIDLDAASGEITANKLNATENITTTTTDSNGDDTTTIDLNAASGEITANKLNATENITTTTTDSNGDDTTTIVLDAASGEITAQELIVSGSAEIPNHYYYGTTPSQANDDTTTIVTVERENNLIDFRIDAPFVEISYHGVEISDAANRPKIQRPGVYMVSYGFSYAGGGTTSGSVEVEDHISIVLFKDDEIVTDQYGYARSQGLEENVDNHSNAVSYIELAEDDTLAVGVKMANGSGRDIKIFSQYLGLHFINPSTSTNTTFSTAKTIRGASNANPVVLTFVEDHGYVNGQPIMIFNAQGMTQLNGKYYVKTTGDNKQVELYSNVSTTTKLNGENFNEYAADSGKSRDFSWAS